jgi:hypothetical protein
MRDLELTHLVIGTAIDIHRTLGPGLLEAVYEECLAKEFTLRSINFKVPVQEDGIRRYEWHYKENDNAEAQSITESRGEAVMDAASCSEDADMNTKKESRKA